MNKIGSTILSIVILSLSNGVYAEDPIDPQSPEAIKQMADQLEADRKAREKVSSVENVKKDDTKTTQNADPGTITSADLGQLKQQCDEAREKLIAPLRKQAIDECIAKKVKSASECEKFYADYGEGGATKSGGYRQRMFHDIPECQSYYSAEEKLKTK